MTVAPGTRIGPYEVVTLLGTGAMGEVYRATDPRLGRDVAIKVLPEEKRASPGRGARFEREARLLASINHPNIATILALEDLGGSSAIVMELVDGPSLADLVARGPLGLAESARIASQIADGLSSAHARGIVHRDLKPANVRIAPDGRVKILDLGLAKMMASDSDAAPEQAPRDDGTLAAETLAAETREGTILGTAPYMSPEQAVGASVDARADVWAFGALLFEMLAGRRAFPGTTIAETLAAVLLGAVDWKALPADVPREVRLLIERCLVHEASGRLNDLAEARDVLRPVTDQTFAATAPRAPADKKSIVVLPFANLSPDPDTEYFSDGLTDEIITDLSLVRALRVISRSSAMRFKGDRGAGGAAGFRHRHLVHGTSPGAMAGGPCRGLAARRRPLPAGCGVGRGDPLVTGECPCRGRRQGRGAALARPRDRTRDDQLPVSLRARSIPGQHPRRRAV
jgi:serine/threonine protein kinase